MDRPWTADNGTQYPANWLRLSSTADRDAIGVTWGADAATWDQRFYWGVDNPKQLDDVTDEDGNTATGLKAQWKATQNQIAASLLAPSDWRVVKELEVNSSFAAAKTAYPTAWQTYRAAIRTSCNTRQAEIDACTTVDELKELLFGSATITRQKTDADGNGVVEPETIVDDDANEVANPIAGQPVMETVANPNIATAWPEEPS
jgi:hypothetical protein